MFRTRQRSDPDPADLQGTNVLRLLSSRSPSWVLAETATAAVFSLMSMLLIGRVIGPHETGLGMVAVAAFALLDIPGAMLYPDSLVQQQKLTRAHGASALTASALIGLAMATIFVALAPLLAASAEAPGAEILCMALAPMLPLSAFSGAASGLVLRQQRFALLACRVLIGQPLALGVGLGLAAGGFGAWAMVAAQATGTLVTFVLMVGLGRLDFRPMLDRAALAGLWPIAGPQVAALAVLVGRYRLFLVALGMLVTEAVLAVSHFAFRMLEAPVVMVLHATGRIAMPRLCSLQHDRDALADAFGDLAQLQALLGMPLAAGIALTAPDLVQALLGPEWAGVAQAAQVVGFASLLLFINGDSVSLFVAVGKPKWNVVINVLALVVPLAALFILQPQTPTGVALAWASQHLLMPFVIGWLVLRELRRSPLWLLGRIAPAIVATGAMATVVAVLEAVLRLSPMVELLASAALGGAVYLAVVWVLLRGRLPRALMRAPGPLPAE
jgi:O-antigen/teichoic acid export membrane protein